jgi:hypothetical protein
MSVNTPESATNDFSVSGQVATKWQATVDSSCVGWRTAVGSEAKGWHEGARTSDATARSITQPIGVGEGVHLSAMVKGTIVSVPGVAPSASPEPAPTPAPSGRVFSSASPYNTPIPPSPVLDANSNAMISQLVAGGAPQAMLHEYGNPVIEPPPGTTGVHVRVENRWAGFYEGNVPIPKGAGPSQGSDASLIVLDRTNNVGWDFWRLKWTGSEWVAGYCSKFPLTGTGAPPEVNCGACGAGVPLICGMIRAAEVKAGVIDHAIDIATSFSATGFRWPATKSDGHGNYPPALPEGARLQLDPAVDLSTLSTALRTIGKAAQTYGVLVKNTTSPNMAMGFEDVGSLVAGNPYYDAGLRDGARLTGIPWNRLRVLEKWDGT